MLFWRNPDKGKLIGGIQVPDQTLGPLRQLGHLCRVLEEYIIHQVSSCQGNLNSACAIKCWLDRNPLIVDNNHALNLQTA